MTVFDAPETVDGARLPKHRFATLAHVLMKAAETCPDTKITYLEDANTTSVESYADLLARARRIANGLRQQGLRRGDLVVILTERTSAFLGLFWGCQLAGLVPVPVGVPMLRRNLNRDGDLSRRFTHLQQPLIVTDPEIVSMLPAQWPVIAHDTLITDISESVTLFADTHEKAFLQFSSGSTGDPRGAVITHANVIANLSAITRHLAVSSADVTVSWMPLHHDMGLCLHLASVFMGIAQTLMTPRLFSRRPGLWLETLSTTRATITGAPNFGLALVKRRVKPEDLAALDLSSVRCLLNGAEPISMDHIADFQNQLAPCGLKPNTMTPCYGLAEATTAVTLHRPGLPVMSFRFDRSSLSEGDLPRGVAGPTEDAVELVSVGEVIPGTSVRIVDPDGRPTLTGRVGGIEIRGQSVSSGYWNDSIGSAALRNGDWTKTGDLGFVRDNCLLIAGREKDTLLVNGITFHAAMLEQKLNQLPLLGDLLVVVIGVVIAQTGQEGVVCFLQKPKLDGASEQALVKAVSEKLSRFLNFPVHRVLVLPRNQIPLTTSGKVRRHKLRQAFERGDFEPAELLPGPKVEITEQSGRSGREEVTRNVLACWADVLGLATDMIELDRDFFDAGGDSLKAIELHSCLEDQWGQLLDQHVLFDCRTVREQVEFLTGVAVRKPCAQNEQTLIAQPVQADAKGVAIVAMAGRFPEAPDLDAFWDILKNGRTTFREPPADRWQANKFFDADPTKPGKTVCRTGSFLDGIEDFDAEAVGLSPEEARQMDPQQRLFLEIVTDLLDQSHLSSKRVGVFAGAAENEYFSRQALDTTRINPMSAHTNLANMLVARVSQQMHFTGPAIGLDAACATSLIAVHYACQSILSGECDAAIAGGVQLNLSEVPQLMFSQAGVLSANGVCAPFSAASDGFVPGEGAGAILLKTVSQALQDGDQVLGVIRGSAVNNDGGATSSMAPSRAGQENVIRDALRAADVAAQDIDFVEGHGTGTRIGDLVEVRALAEIFEDIGPRRLGLGSVKSNVGHLFHAAGICGMIKVLMAFRHQEFPPIANSNQLNPQIPFDQINVRPVQQPASWPRNQTRPRIAGISAFGVGGTNCHVIVQEPPVFTATASPRDVHLLCLSAPSADDLQRVAETYSDTFSAQPDAPLSQLCAGVNQRATRFAHRRFVLARDHAGAIAQLRQHRMQPSVSAKQARTTFLFVGPSGLYHGVASHLQGEQAFSDALDQCDQAMGPICGQSLISLISDRNAALNSIEIAQPVSFALSYAMTRWLEGLGISADSVIGHSGGELAAAWAAGVVGFETACQLAVARGAAMALTAPGAMVAVDAAAKTVQVLIARHRDVVIACYNSTNQVVISGPKPEVCAALETLTGAGHHCERIAIDCASHSPLMAPAQEALAAILRATTLRKPKVPFYSTVTGSRLDEISPDDFIKGLERPVLFTHAVNAALGAGFDTFVDVGSTGTLARHAAEIALADVRDTASDTRAVSLLRKSVPGWAATHDGLGKLFERGLALNLMHLDGHLRGPVHLPAYPYQRKRLWIDRANAAAMDAPGAVAEMPAPGQAGFARLGVGRQPWIEAHRVFGKGSAPSGLVLDLLLAETAAGDGALVLNDVLIEKPLENDIGSDRELRVIELNGKTVLETRDAVNGELWKRHLSARADASDRQPSKWKTQVDLSELGARCPYQATPGQLAERLADSGMTYGPALDTIIDIGVGHRELIVNLDADRAVSRDATFARLDPGLIDGAMRAVGAFTLPFPPVKGAAFLCFSIQSLSIFAPVTGPCTAHLTLAPDCSLGTDARTIRYDIAIYDSHGKCLAGMEGVSLVRQDGNSEPAVPDRQSDSNDCLYEVDLHPVDRPVSPPTQDDSRLTLILAHASPWRAQLEARLEGQGGIPLSLSPPQDPSRWSGFLAPLALSTSAMRDANVVLETHREEDVAGFANALNARGVGALNRLLIITPKRSVAAFANCLALEFPNWNCRIAEHRSDQVQWQELLGAPVNPDVAHLSVHRENTRHQYHLKPIITDDLVNPLTKNGVYWITGGMGAIGAALAMGIARRCQATIVLTGRSPLPDQSVLDAVSDVNGTAHYFQCDVTDRVAMAKVHDQIKTRWHRLDGVVHAAGLVQDHLILDRPKGHGAAVMRAKVDGARILADLTEKDAPDFLAFCSSMVALSGAPGQSDYAAANAALDDMAGTLRAAGRAVTSIGWGPWAIGMASAPHLQSAYRGKGLNPFSATRGVDAFMRAISTDKPHVVAVPIGHIPEADLLAAFNSASLQTPIREADRVSVDATHQPQYRTLWDALQGIVAEQLRVDPETITSSMSLNALGIDSLMAVEIAIALQPYLNTRPYPTLLLEVSTLEELLERLKSLQDSGGGA